MGAGVDWAEAASFPAQYLADLAVQQLEAAGIPVLVKGESTGIWGPGYVGPTPWGIRLLVPADRLDEAREILEPGEDPELEEAEL